MPLRFFVSPDLTTSTAFSMASQWTYSVPEWFTAHFYQNHANASAASDCKGENEVVDIDEPEQIIPGKETCSVCFEPMSVDELVKLDCGHMYHGSCIIRWLNTKVSGNWGDMDTYHRHCVVCRSRVHQFKVKVEGKNKGVRICNGHSPLNGIYVTSTCELTTEAPVISQEEIEEMSRQEEEEEWETVMGAVLD